MGLDGSTRSGDNAHSPFGFAASLFDNQADRLATAPAVPQGQSGPKPIELVLLAVGGCTAFDVIGILRKKRQAVTGYEIQVAVEQRTEPPNYFTRAEILHRLHGSVDPKAVEQAIHLSESKCCSVGAMISKTATIKSRFEIIADAVTGSAA